MIDTLVQHLLEEIAMDGQAGTDVSRLSSFIQDFYATPSSSTDTPLATTSSSSQPAQQNTDPAFLSFVWDTLLGQEDVHVGVLTPIKSEEKEEDPEPAAEEEEGSSRPGTPAPTSEQEADEGPQYKGNASKGRGKNKLAIPKRKKKAKDIGKQGTHQLELIEGERKAWSREKLVETYGEALRIAVGAETAWVAITGSSMRPTSLTPPVYTVLEHVSRARGEGATVITIGRDLGVDQKSAFHFVRVAVNLGIVKKFRTIEHGAWTNRILHVRYLSVSPHWAIFKASDEGVEEGAAEGAAGGDSDDEGAGAGVGTVRRVGAIGRNHIVTNPGLIKKRVVRALKSREQQFMPHSQMASSIGLYNYSRLDLRRLNQLLSNMCKDGILEKTLVEHQFSGNAQGKMQVQCLRLLEGKKGKKDDTANSESNANAASSSNANAELTANAEPDPDPEDEEDDDSPHPLALISIERQVIDLLVEANAEGLTHADIAHSLGSLPVRTVDQMLARLSRSQSLPSHLKDLTLHLVTETVGREKRSRWFTLVGYLRRCERDHVIDAAMGLVPTLGGKEVGGWAEVKQGEVYETARERWDKVKNLDLKKGGKVKNGGLGAAQREDVWRVGERAAELEELKRVRAEKKEAKGKGKGKEVVKVEEDVVASDQPDEEEEEDRIVEDQNAAAPAADSTVPAPSTSAAAIPKPKQTKKLKKAAPAPSPAGSPSPSPSRASSSAPPDIKPSAFNYDGTPVTRGRPRKHPPKVGKLTYYERRKIEDEERAKMGMEPRKIGEKKDEEVEQRVKKRVEEWKKSQRKAAGMASESDEEAADADANANAEASTSSSKADSKAKGKTKTKTKTKSTPAPAPATKTRSGRTSIAVLKPIEIDELESDDAVEESEAQQSTSKSKDTDAPSVSGWAPPRPRSTAVPADEDSPMPDAEPTPPPTKRGPDRPRKSDVAASTSTSTKGKEKEVTSTRKRARTSEAPEADQEDSDEDVSVVPSSSREKEKDAPAPPSSTQRPKKRLKPVVEVFVRSPKKKSAPAMVKGKEKETEREKSVEMIEVDELESDEEVEKEKEGAKEKQVQEIVIDEDEDEDEEDAVASDAAQPQSDAIAPTSELSISSSPAPSATPLNRRVGQLARTSTDNRTRSRGLSSTPSTPKASHSFLAKQTEVVTYLEHPSTGGFCEYDIHFVTAVRAFFKKYHPDKPGAKHTMDKRSANEIITGLIERKLIKKTTVSTPSGRVDVILLASVPLDDPKFTAFVAKLSGRKLIRTGKVPDLRVAEDLSLDDGLAPRALGMLEEPGVDDDSEIVKDYFRRIPGVAGAKFGALYGRIARARHLHHWLIQWVSNTEEGANLISTSPVVFTHPTLTSFLPLGDYLRIVTLPIDSREFEAFVADPANLDTPLASLPKNIFAMLKPDTALRQRALWPAVETLVHLGLLVPLVLALGDKSQTLEHTYQRPTKSTTATHWQLNPQAPVYAFARKTNPLVAILDVTSTDGASAYWEKLHEVSFPGNVARHAVLDETEAGPFPLSFEGAPAGFASKIMTSSTKWHDGYMLLRSQRKYLTKLVAKDHKMVEDEEAMVRISNDTVAPREVVERYMRHVHASKERRSEKAKKKNKKIRRAKRRKMAADGEEGEGGADDDDEEPASDVEQTGRAAPRRARRSRGPNKKKHTDASAARELAFTAIIDRFKTEHGQPILAPRIIDFLRQRFCFSTRGLINADQLQSELRLLLPDGHIPGYRSIVPANIRRQVELGDDPYSLPAAKMFSSRKSRSTLGSRQKALPKPLAEKPVASTSRDADSGADGEGDDQAMSGDDEAAAAAAAAAAPPMLDEADYPSLTLNRQNEFLTTPARAAPELKGNGRLPRNFFSAEQDDLLLDASAILKARAEYVGRRVVWTPLSQLFSEIPAPKMRHHFKRLIQSREEETYHDRLVEAWHVEWEKKRGSPELPDDHPQDQLRFELADFVRCLRANVDKQALRLTGPRPATESTVPVIKLPSTLTEFQSKFVVDSRSGNRDEALRWDRYWKTGLSGANREDEAAAAPFSTICSTEESPALNHELIMTEEALKMLYVTPDKMYTPARGNRFLKSFESNLEPAIKDLLDNSVIIKPKSVRESTRRGPGRGHSLSERFQSSFEDLISPSKSLIASHKERELLGLGEDNSIEWPLFALEGDMISLIRLASEGKVSMNVDTSTTAAFRDPNDYQTRQKDDEAYELSVFVSANPLAGPFDVRSEPPRVPPTFPRDGHTTDPDALAAARSELDSAATDEAAAAINVLDLVTAAGCVGLSFNAQLPQFDSEALKKAQKTLTSHTPPLAFFAGETAVSLIASQFLSSWTVAVLPRKNAPNQPEADQEDATSQDESNAQEQEAEVEQSGTPEAEDEDDTALTRIFPAPWRDLHGDLQPTMWEKATGWIKGLLLLHSGSTTQQLFARSETLRLLTLPQVLMLLETLEEWGVVERREVEGVDGEGEGEKQLGWDDARFYLTASWE
ncbi:hypothetical protein BCR35DRAFT_302649 [Leucosporidium creatinivorum]|uniref:Transcription factor tau subunit sfc3/Tfc3 C-terminal domain-containing protein n=1 Tax=Leucosporidium creatinivorum TaxID=106004 RepID=A0A1Y2FPU5_9BASI|nr:hypothetical protein BCR35DRAFT_302649 [Leucosporidium creatinivorum]